MRIVSLVPSLTELLFSLGLEEEVVGITKFCIHPEKWFKSKTRIGGTKTVKLEIVEQLQPDLIIANKEENQKEQIEALQQKFRVLLTDINSLPEAYSAIQEIGSATHTNSQAGQLIKDIQQEWAFCKTKCSEFSTKQVLYLIWRNPYMAAGTNTFISQVLQELNFNNCLSNGESNPDFSRYPQLTNDQIIALKPALIFLSSEPYPFKNKHIEELQQWVPTAKIILVDGEAFSWYGSRMLHAPAHFHALCERIAYI